MSGPAAWRPWGDRDGNPGSTARRRRRRLCRVSVYREHSRFADVFHADRSMLYREGLRDPADEPGFQRSRDGEPSRVTAGGENRCDVTDRSKRGKWKLRDEYLES